MEKHWCVGPQLLSLAFKGTKRSILPSREEGQVTCSSLGSCSVRGGETGAISSGDLFAPQHLNPALLQPPLSRFRAELPGAGDAGFPLSSGP